MAILITAAIVGAIVLIGYAQFGWGACALATAAFLLWWDGQPGPALDADLFGTEDQRPAAKHPKGK